MRKSEKEALQAMLDDEQETIKALEKAYQRAIRRIDNHIRILESDEMTQSKIYQKRYQEAMKAQINAALDELHKKSNQTIEEYLTRSYQHGYVGTMYSLHKQGMPILAPIDQRAVTRAVRTDSKLSGRLYGELGVDMQKLKKTIRREISIGISIGSDYNMIARQVQISSGIPLKRAKTIVRTEGHRIQQQSADDARNAAKGQGCQVVKQWDAVLDGNTRTDHRILDGQIREVGEPFEIDGKKAEYPGAFGRPEEDCNCRCVALTRAKWALDADELQTMKDRAKFFGLDKTEGFREFEEKYLKAAEESEMLHYEQERITKSRRFAVDSKVIESRAYADKFDSMANSPQERREFLKAAKELLQHRSGQNGEDLYLYNRENQKWVKSITGQAAETPEYTQDIISTIERFKAKKQLVAFHNHPGSMPPSDSDLNAARQNGYSVGYVLCHDGRIFEYTMPSREVRATIYNLLVASFKEKGYNEDEAQIETLKVLATEYSFRIREVK